MKHVRCALVACVAIFSSSGPHAAFWPAMASVGRPTVTGPIAATAAPGDPSHQYPFFSTSVDLASRGYVEAEYFLEGTASRFNIPVPLTDANTPQATAIVTQTGVSYRTRMVVRRPISSRDFNGTVVMEWQNVSFGFDVDALWAASSEHMLRRGYAWIGVSVQRVGVSGPRGLTAWSPARYSTLDVTAGGTILDDSLSFDIFSQAAEAVRNPASTDPMGGLRVTSLIATGVSQGALYLVAYQNAVHPLAGVFDGFMPLVSGGVVRPDSDARAFKVLTETDVARNQVAFRQLDTARF